jgi:hypothetical protein
MFPRINKKTKKSDNVLNDLDPHFKVLKRNKRIEDKGSIFN